MIRGFGWVFGRDSFEMHYRNPFAMPFNSHFRGISPKLVGLSAIATNHRTPTLGTGQYVIHYGQLIVVHYPLHPTDCTD